MKALHDGQGLPPTPAAPCQALLGLLALMLLAGSVRADSQLLLQGQRAWGILASGDEQDDWLIDALAGSSLTLSVKSSKKEGLLPTISVHDLSTRQEVVPADGQLKGVGKPGVKLIKLLLPSTGSYALRVGSSNGVPGSYKLTQRLKSPGGGKLKQVLSLQAFGAGLVTFDALPGSPALISITPGADTFVNAFSGPVSFIAITQPVKGKRRLLQDLDGKTLVLPDLGTYFLQLSNSSDAPLDVKVSIRLKRIKLPKGTSKTSSELVGAVSFALPNSVSPAEKAPGKGHAVELILALPEGVALPSSVKVPLVDTGAGSASSGKDYVPLHKAKAVFAKGSLNGARASAWIRLKDDKLPEGEENLSVGLGTPSAFASVDPGALHLLTIMDDDPQAKLDVRVGGVDGPSLPSDGSLDLGSAALGGQGAPTFLALANDGDESVLLFPPRLPAGQRDFWVQEVLSLVAAPGFDPAALAAWDPASEATRALPHAAPMPDGSGARLLPPLDLDIGTHTQELVLLGVPLPEGRSTQLVLNRRPLPFSPDSRLDLDGAAVPGGPLALLDGHSLWSGRVAGRPDTRVFLGLARGGLWGWIERPEGRVNFAPRRGVDGSWSRPRTAVYDELQAAALSRSAQSFRCDALQPGGMPSPPWEAAAPPSSLASSPDGFPFRCRVALETDVELAARFDGDVGALLAYTTNLWGALSHIYEGALNTVFTLEYVGVHANGSDPWFGADTPARLTEFRQAWKDDWPVDADLAHMLSGADLGGGIAYIGALCSQQWGFAVSGNLGGVVASDSGGGTPSWDVIVTAHETGHNFGAPHTHEICPVPIDQCAPPEFAGACQLSTGVCQLGTIMSYCHLCGGVGSIQLQFHEQIDAIMTAQVSGSCLLAPRYLHPGSVLGYELSFTPKSGLGLKGDAVRIEHDAFNQPAPYVLNLTGTAFPQ